MTHRAGRAGVPFLFLAAWAGLSFARAWWLGDPIAVPLHQMGSGALLVFYASENAETVSEDDVAPATLLAASPADTADDLAARLLPMEHRLYPAVLRKFANNDDTKVSLFS